MDTFGVIPTICEPISTAYPLATNGPCYLGNVCKFKSLLCSNYTCTPRTKMAGDACVKNEECLHSTITSPFGSVCVNNVCVPKPPNKVIPLNSRCTYPNFGYIVDQCVEGSACIGGNCTATDGTQGSYCSQSQPCKSGLSCLPTNGAKTGTCGIPQSYGTECRHFSYCQPQFACRKSSASDTSQKCIPWSTMGGYCQSQYECVGGFDSLSSCINNKCVRKYGALTGEACFSNTDCYSGYCSTTTSTCVNINPQTDSCSTCKGACICNGQMSTSATNGTCVDLCLGLKTDAETCLYNLGIVYTIGALFPVYNLVPGLNEYQWSDESSSAYSSCKDTFAKYYSCLKYNLGTVGGMGSFAGVGNLNMASYDPQSKPTPVNPVFQGAYNGTGLGSTRAVSESSMMSLSCRMMILLLIMLFYMLL